MAKQKVNLRDTLQRNKQPQVELAPKVTLKKTDKDLEKISETVDFIHNETHETPQVEDPQLPFVMLVTEMKPNPFEGFDPDAPSKEQAPLLPSPTRLVRISLDTPKDVHLQLKIKAVQRGQTIREYLLDLIAIDLSK